MASGDQISVDETDRQVALIDRVLVGTDGDADPGRAWELYEAEATGGSALAAERLAVMEAVGVARPASFGAGLDQLVRAANLGQRSAQKQLALFADRGDLLARAPKAPIWAKVRSEIDDATLLEPPRPQLERLSPAIRSIAGLIPKSYCRWIIDRGRQRLVAGMVSHIDGGAARLDTMRTAKAAPFTLTQTDLVVVLVQQRLAQAMRVPAYHYEPPNLLHYAVGQQYERHFDFIDPRVPAFQDELAVFGQRIVTCLVYLNDGYEGGETEFPSIGWRYRGKPGDALIFNNVTPQGQPDASSLHAGTPPTRGEKWVLSQWVRDRVQPIT